jgi:hypothetical protein
MQIDIQIGQVKNETKQDYIKTRNNTEIRNI